MSYDHPILVAVGVVAVGLGVAMLYSSQLAGTIGADYVVVKAIGLLALVQGLRIVYARKRTDIDQGETPDPETTPTMRTPGTEFDETIGSLHLKSRRNFYETQNAVRERLAESAVSVLMHRENYSEEEARERLDAGTWTDDPYAASFLAESNVQSTPWREWFRGILSDQTSFQRQAHRTADAISRRARADESPDGDAGRPASTEGES